MKDLRESYKQKKERESKEIEQKSKKEIIEEAIKRKVSPPKDKDTDENKKRTLKFEIKEKIR